MNKDINNNLMQEVNKGIGKDFKCINDLISYIQSLEKENKQLKIYNRRMRVSLNTTYGGGRDTLLERICKEIQSNLKQGKTIQCIHITKEDFEQIKQGNIFITPSEIDKTTLFGYPVKEDFITFIE